MAENINKEKMKAENKQYSEKEKNEEETLKTLREQGYRVSSPCFCEMLEAGTAKGGPYTKERVSSCKEDHEHERRLLEQLGSEKGRKRREIAVKEGKCYVCCGLLYNHPKNRERYLEIKHQCRVRQRRAYAYCILREDDPICDIASLFDSSNDSKCGLLYNHLKNRERYVEKKHLSRVRQRRAYAYCILRENDPICDIASLFDSSNDSKRIFSAQIETLLKKEDVTLFELMDEDELLQECKAQNRKLVYFLTRAEVLDEMVYLVVNEPSAEGEMQMRFKYANLAAELLTADVPAIIDKLVASTSLLDILYKFLEKEKPLNPLLASFFSKVLGMLVQRRSEQVLDFLKSKGDFVELAVQHVGTSAIMDLLLKLICNVEEDKIRQRVHQWLNEGQLVERLVDKLSPDADPEDHASADNLLCEISTSCRDTSSDGHQQNNPLLATLESEDTVNKLLDLLLHEDRNDSSLSHVINILLTLMSARTQQQQIQHQQQQQQGLQQSASVDSSDSESSDGRKNAVARIIAKRLPSLQNILMDPPKGLPGDKATQWDDFVSNALAELNRKNEIAPVPGFKEMDMDVIGDFRYADDEFKDPDDNLSGPLQALALSGASGLGSGAPAAGQAVDGGGEAKNFLSSRGLMKTSGENADISEAGTTPPIPSENDEETSRPPSPPKGETLPESTAQN